MAKRCTLAAVFAVLMSASIARADSPSLATAIKATYLDKFGDFVDWPAGVLHGPNDPVRLCVVGDNPFGAVLDQAARGQRIGSHPLQLLRLNKTDRIGDCHILFAAGSSRDSVAMVLEKVKGAPILTVTDGGNDPAARGMINFVELSNHVRFEIDNVAAARAGLTISSKLLSLAVRPEGG